MLNCGEPCGQLKRLHLLILLLWLKSIYLQPPNPGYGNGSRRYVNDELFLALVIQGTEPDQSRMMELPQKALTPQFRRVTSPGTAC